MDISDKMVEKSKEAFLMAIEIYNKPSIKYRVEGFGYFICNAWELLLKAYLIKNNGISSIYFPDNPARTLSLEICIKKIFTNDKDPLRLNLEKIIELRNISTHFVVEEYEMVYIPLFQACVFNYIEKSQTLLDIDITQIIPPNFLTLTVSFYSINENDVRTKYPETIANKLISLNSNLSNIINENNNRFAIQVNHHYFLTKDKDKASACVYIDKNADKNITIVKELQDPNNTHKYPCKKCCEEINRRLTKLNISIKFNVTTFSLFDKYYGIKRNSKFCYTTKTFSQPQYSYSIHAIDFIVEEIKKDPENIIQNLKSQIKK